MGELDFLNEHPAIQGLAKAIDELQEKVGILADILKALSNDLTLSFDVLFLSLEDEEKLDKIHEWKYPMS